MAQEEFEGKVKVILDLALELKRAKEPKDGEGRGRAVFLIGAGCSVSAGIKSAPEVAKICAVQLANTYSDTNDYDEKPLEAYLWLQQKGYMSASAELKSPQGEPDWGGLYQYFFEHHIKTPIEQKEFINKIIADSDKKLNWTHACLGELVSKKYVHTVLTTNFDQLVLQGIVRTGEIPVIADGLESLNRIDSRPKWPQVVHLHGSKHTYTLRNSASSLDAVIEDPATMGLMSRLFQEAHLLVVVGHSGNDRGLMTALARASLERPDFLIYWVAFDRFPDHLSPAAKQLLKGGNKFFIGAGPSDQFFATLMRELGLGGPQWVINPVSAMKAESERLVAPDSIDYVKSLIDGYRQRVAFADDHRYNDNDNPKALAGALAAKGDLIGAIGELEKINWRLDREASKLHADFKLELFKQDPEVNRKSLDEALEEFSSLVKNAPNEERSELVKALVRAKLNILDFNEDGRDILEQFLDELEKWAAEFEPVNSDCLAIIYAAEGQVLQALSEISKDEDGKAENNILLKRSIESFEKALRAFELTKQIGRTYIETKAGYAAAVQSLGLGAKSVEELQKAIRIFEEVKEGSQTNTYSVEDAGLLLNLANAQKDLIVLASSIENFPGNIRAIIASATENLAEAEAIYRREGDQNHLEDLGRIRGEFAGEKT